MTFSLHHQRSHSWPPLPLRAPLRSHPTPAPIIKSSSIDANPFAFFISADPTDDGILEEYFSAGIGKPLKHKSKSSSNTRSSRSYSPPFHRRRGSRDDDENKPKGHEKILRHPKGKISTVTQASRSPRAILNRFLLKFSEKRAHLFYRRNHKDQPRVCSRSPSPQYPSSPPSPVFAPSLDSTRLHPIQDFVPATPANSPRIPSRGRSRNVNHTRSKTYPPRRPKSWREPSQDLWPVLEEKEGSESSKASQEGEAHHKAGEISEGVRW
ncbi:MAG: hypothetical protein M1834_004717 [Cirrosporium novae-zelandiae]|nr:MAG: hypothetical protein M1834_004717 [Cirrosporium novae-zelandiae]